MFNLELLDFNMADKIIHLRFNYIELNTIIDLDFNMLFKINRYSTK